MCCFIIENSIKPTESTVMLSTDPIAAGICMDSYNDIGKFNNQME